MAQPVQNVVQWPRRVEQPLNANAEFETRARQQDLIGVAVALYQRDDADAERSPPRYDWLSSVT